jgi:hypothetical protein
LTEAEWLASADPDALLGHVTGWASARKLRLFCCGYWQRLALLWRDDIGGPEVEVAYRHADGLANERQLWAAHAAAQGILTALSDSHPNPPQGDRHARYLAQAARAATAALSMQAARDTIALAPWAREEISGEPAPQGAFRRMWTAATDVLSGFRHRSPEHAAQAVLLRDLFGNPFRQSFLNPSLRARSQGVIQQLAEAMYADRAFDRLPLLADAIEEVGGTDAAILDHCRHPGPHYRGCWVIDLILGRE